MTTYTILIEALKEIAEMTDPDDPDSYRADDPQGCLDTINYVAAMAIAEFERRDER